MKRFLILSIFIGSTFFASAQAVSGGSKNNNHAKKSSAQIRGTGQYHGSKDTTPGSPMGTGGAGGTGMSGSPAGSASKTAMQQSKVGTTSNDQGSDSSNTASKKGAAKRKG